MSRPFLSCQIVQFRPQRLEKSENVCRLLRSEASSLQFIREIRRNKATAKPLETRSLPILSATKAFFYYVFLDRLAYALLPCANMVREMFCDHCERALTSKAYRVISEDPGGILLDMLVCHPCNQKARELGLKTCEVDVDERSLKRG